MDQQTGKKSEARNNTVPPSQVNKLAELAGAASTDEALDLVCKIVEELGASLEKIILTRDGNSETINVRANKSGKSVEIHTDVADGRTRLSVVCCGPLSARLKQDIEAILQVGALSAELVARKLWQPAEVSEPRQRQNAGLVGESSSMKALASEIEKLGRSARPVMITGERGTGKTTVARAIHENSERKGEFVDLDCTALTESLLESELFGYEKGAFTGAGAPKRGMFEVAEGGTLFLDEIGDLPLGMQAKLLKAIEQQKLRRLGATKDTRINVRIIAATSKNISQMRSEGLFREDLYDRLSVLEIRTCPLREKREDIPAIISLQLQEEKRLAGRELPYEIEQAAVELLQSYDWPGNIRQLRNFITKLVVNNEGLAPISVEDVSHVMELTSGPQPANPEEPAEGSGADEKFSGSNVGQILLPEDIRRCREDESLHLYMYRAIKILIETRLSLNNGNVSATARQLGVERSTLRERLAYANQMLQEAA